MSKQYVFKYDKKNNHFYVAEKDFWDANQQFDDRGLNVTIPDFFESMESAYVYHGDARDGWDKLVERGFIPLQKNKPGKVPEGLCQNRKNLCPPRDPNKPGGGLVFCPHATAQAIIVAYRDYYKHSSQVFGSRVDPKHLPPDITDMFDVVLKPAVSRAELAKGGHYDLELKLKGGRELYFKRLDQERKFLLDRGLVEAGAHITIYDDKPDWYKG